MPQLNINLPPELWSVLELHGSERGDSPDAIVISALSEYFHNNRDRLYQVSTSGALVEGVCDGALEVGTLRKYGDLGIGTFEHLDGEMVVVDGRVFQVRSDGSVSEVADDVLTPYATVARFQPDVEVLLKQCPDFARLSEAFDRLRPTENMFFSLRVDGYFDYVRTRALCRMKPGTRLIDAATVQPDFEYRNVYGTLVGFWSPQYSKALSIPGYHLHFLSEDCKGGGHLLECRGAELTLRLQRGTQFNLVLPETSSFLVADLTRDPSEDLEKAESYHPEKVK
ncbi:acetolactate decarboxylase [Edaphobacter sp. HDX4]|uniref:acetolactate decarboxylase n=1 Tax=Edaphobacter sp. HDX4 TaxID=2794064 RepID=UPI002FE64A0D